MGTQGSAQDQAIEWLLRSDEPAVRYVTRRDLLGGQPSTALETDRRQIVDGPKVSVLLAGQDPNASYGYPNWGGDQWRLLALTDLAVPPDESRARAAAERVLDAAIARPQHQGRPTIVDGLARFCTSLEGAALVIASRLGMTDDPRVRLLADALIEWQWPDGGWNCHRNASGRRSTFHESVLAARGLHKFGRATRDSPAMAAADRTAELFLEHRLVYSNGSGRPSRRHKVPRPAGAVIDPRWLKLGYPSYWHYDVLAAMIFLTAIGRIDDPRATPGLDHLEQRRRPDGLWAPDRQWWVPADKPSRHQHEIVDWGRAGEPNEMITLHALRILRAAKRD